MTRSGAQSLGVNILFMTFGAVLLYSGWKGIDLVDAALGRSPDGSRSETITARDVPGNVRGGTVAQPLTDPDGAAIFDHKRIPKFAAQELNWARNHGWKGQLLSVTNAHYRVSQSGALRSILQLYPSFSRLLTNGLIQ